MTLNRSMVALQVGRAARSGGRCESHAVRLNASLHRYGAGAQQRKPMVGSTVVTAAREARKAQVAPMSGVS
jgi:hypothetical protein